MARISMGDVRARIRGAVAVVVVLLARGVAAIVSPFWGARARPDAFYDAPATVPGEPGRLLRHEPHDRGIPGGARAWRVLYTTTRADGTPAVASGLVVVPSPRPPGALPVIAWAHGTTGIARQAAPSLLDRPFFHGAMPALGEVLARGWAVVATDYPGLGTASPHGYLVGGEAGRAVLDAVRAARELEAAGAQGDVVAWGHSQGGGAALWTGLTAPGYARDVPLRGVVALAPASDLTVLTRNMANVPIGAIFASYTIAAFAATYPEIRVDDWVRPGCRRLARVMAARGIQGADGMVALVAALAAPSPIWSGDPAAGALGARLAENVPSSRIAVPVLVAQGEADPLVPADIQAAFAATLRAGGTDVDYRSYPGLDHGGVVADDAPSVPEILNWTAARLGASR